jgi:hypothetical protein
MSAPWARDGEPDAPRALALVGREALGANRDGRAHITTSRVIVTWNHIEIGISGEASITAGAMPAVLGQIGFVGAVVVQHGPLRMIERSCPIISSIRNALECKLAARCERRSMPWIDAIAALVAFIAMAGPVLVLMRGER